MKPLSSLSAVAERPAEKRAGIRSTRRRRIPSGQLTDVNDCRSIVGRGVTTPRFLTSRIGRKWAAILAELRSASWSNAEFHGMVHALSEFVETNAIGAWNQPRHGSGLLAGQPLTVGWRRRLYVCPDSDQLKWIPSSTKP